MRSFSLIFGLAACAEATSTTERVDVITEMTPNVPAGEAVYNAECASCHGADGEGGIGPSFVAAFDAFHERGGSWEIEVRSWVEAVIEGIPGSSMPSMGDALTDQQIADVIEYTHATWGM